MDHVLAPIILIGLIFYTVVSVVASLQNSREIEKYLLANGFVLDRVGNIRTFKRGWDFPPNLKFGDDWNPETVGVIVWTPSIIGAVSSYYMARAAVTDFHNLDELKKILGDTDGK